MSEVGWYTAKLKFGVKEHIHFKESIPFEILKRSFEECINKHGGHLTDYVKNFYGEKTNCDLAAISPEFPYGIGVKIDPESGKVIFLYDEYAIGVDTGKKLSKEILQNCVAISLIKAMKSLGYYVEVEEEDSNIVLTGKLGERKIKTRIETDGKFEVDFIGFIGEECTDERERLRKILIDSGVETHPEKIIKKHLHQISSDAIRNIENKETGVHKRDEIKNGLRFDSNVRVYIEEDNIFIYEYYSEGFIEKIIEAGRKCGIVFDERCRSMCG